ncbi:hypothetical protein TC41_0167 [Alicyclobacillus acidocaldarius subsp. acidocaldarius Tc-4-1]|uniref:Uncharacterized protein n=1 Tax=Alicyclobacillus acidocaldarius (strain Tc-4-1) TaxID=1048834 RepID=F8IIZ4_ALIAT|nr:hypothetical protein TC41_0167 [Alicyclobacillus acidocaldarius subsp. acidocaldarius Tc-4-1]
MRGVLQDLTVLILAVPRFRFLKNREMMRFLANKKFFCARCSTFAFCGSIA